MYNKFYLLIFFSMRWIDLAAIRRTQKKIGPLKMSATKAGETSGVNYF